MRSDIDIHILLPHNYIIKLYIYWSPGFSISYVILWKKHSIGGKGGPDDGGCGRLDTHPPFLVSNALALGGLLLRNLRIVSTESGRKVRKDRYSRVVTLLYNHAFIFNLISVKFTILLSEKTDELCKFKKQNRQSSSSQCAQQIKRKYFVEKFSIIVTYVIVCT